MGHGVFKAYSFTMAAAGTTATVDMGRSYSRVYLQIPTMTSSTALDVYVSPNGTQTYYQLRKEVANSATAQMFTFTVAATCAVNGALVPIPAGFQFIKLIATDSAPAAATGFQVLCGD